MDITDFISLGISIVALIISATTAYLTFFRRGTVKLTQPTIIFFGFDEPGEPKIFIRGLLFATAKRGRVIESMSCTLSRNETHQNFNFWSYGEANKLVPGSGLYAGESGVATNHHFVISEGGQGFQFMEGKYLLEVFVQLYGTRKQIKLFSYELIISEKHANDLQSPDMGLFYNWGQISQKYIPRTDRRTKVSNTFGS